MEVRNLNVELWHVMKAAFQISMTSNLLPGTFVLKTPRLRLHSSSG